MQGSTEFDITAIGPKRFGLQVEQDQASTGTVGNSHKLSVIAEEIATPRFHNERHSFCLHFPNCFVGKFLVGQCSLTPSGIQETNTSFLVTHISDRCLNGTPISIRFSSLQGSLSAQFLNELMHLGQVRASLLPKPS